MKISIKLLVLVLFVGSVCVHAQSKPLTSDIKGLAVALSDAYGARDLGRLDSKRVVSGTVKFIIEHSLADDNDKGRFVVKSFKKMAAAEAWIKSRAIDADFPGRSPIDLKSCKGGVCKYDLNGLLHNQLYLSKFTYTYSKGRYYIKTVYLIDGD